MARILHIYTLMSEVVNSRVESDIFLEIEQVTQLYYGLIHLKQAYAGPST